MDCIRIRTLGIRVRELQGKHTSDKLFLYQDRLLAQVQFFFDQVKILAQQKKAVFIRFRPQEVETVELEALVKKIGGEKSPMHLTADLTLQLDLSQPQEVILASMRKNTRYEVKKAEKLGIRVTTSSDVEDIKQFYQHQLYLAKKHAFVPFSFEFFCLYGTCGDGGGFARKRHRHPHP